MAAAPTMVGWMNRAVAWCWWSSFRLNNCNQQHRRLSLAVSASSSSARRRGQQQQQNQQQLSSFDRVLVVPTLSSPWFGPIPTTTAAPSSPRSRRIRRRGRSMGKSSKKYYAVAKGRKVGIFDTWEECSSLVRGFKMARYKSFPTRQEAASYLTSFTDVASCTSADPSHAPPPPPPRPDPPGTHASSLDDARTGPDVAPPPPLRSGMKRPLGAPAPLDVDAGRVPAPPQTSEKRSTNATHIIMTNPYTKKAAATAPPPFATFSRDGAGVGRSAARTPLGAGSTGSTSRAGDSTAHARRPTNLTIHINFDGGSRGNPGLAGAGASVTVSSSEEPLEPPRADSTGDVRDVDNRSGGRRRTIHIRHFLTRTATNNEAEYEGLVAALRVAKQQAQSVLHCGDGRGGDPSFKPRVKLIVQGDSDLIIKQLKGSYRVRNPKLVPLYQQAMCLIQEVRTMAAHGGSCEVVYEHVYREYNKVADGLANQAMDGQRSWMTSSEEGNHSVEMNLPFD